MVRGYREIIMFGKIDTNYSKIYVVEVNCNSSGFQTDLI